MPRRSLPITDGYYEDALRPISSQQLVNMYVVPVGTNGLSNGYLRGVAGIEEVADSGQGKTRGSIVFGGNYYRVDGSRLVRVNSDLTVTDLGSIPGGGRLSMATNDKNILIVSPTGPGYFYDETNGLEKIVDPNFYSYGQARTVVFIDGYYVLNTDDVIFNSSLVTTNDGKDFDPLDFGTAEVKPDKITSVAVYRNQLYAMGTETIEVFSNVGGEGFPFQRIEGALINKGSFCRHVAVEFDNSLWFVGNEKNEQPGIWRINGGVPQKMSTIPIDYAISGKTDFDDYFGWTYGQEGAYFVGFNFADDVFCFESVGGKWCERILQNPIQTVDKAYDRLLVGSTDGKVGELKMDVYTEYGVELPCYFSTSPFNNDGDQFFVPEVEMKCRSGAGNILDEDPKVWLQWSWDNGYTFNNKLERQLGGRGDVTLRQIWRRLNWVDDSITLRFGISDRCERAFLKLEADFNG